MPVLDLLDVAPATLDDDALLQAASSLAEVRRRVDAKQAEVAAEIAHRSRHDDGYGGLAQRTGARTPEILVQRLTGASKREAGALVQVGVQLTEDADPWLTAVGSAVAGGSVSIGQADAIRTGLGAPTPDVAADDLADAANRLLDLTPTLTVEQLAARAREARDDLDAAGVRDRERALREKRYLVFTKTADGMTRVHGLLDPSSTAIVSAVYDAVTSPRRGGVRFVDPDDRAASDDIVADDRTTGQLALDAFVDLIRIGAEAEPDRVPGTARHAVRVLVAARDLDHPHGIGFLDGQTDAISAATVATHVCDTGILPIEIDRHGDPLRLGRRRRLYTTRQREALVARDGGCRYPGCDRPASWTEAHHTVPWSDGGPTDIDTGILLCRHHHLLLHDTEWRIDRDAVHGFVAIPPPTRDPHQRPIPMPTRSRALRRLLN